MTRTKFTILIDNPEYAKVQKRFRECFDDFISTVQATGKNEKIKLAQNTQGVKFGLLIQASCLWLMSCKYALWANKNFSLKIKKSLTTTG